VATLTQETPSVGKTGAWIVSIGGRMPQPFQLRGVLGAVTPPTKTLVAVVVAALMLVAPALAANEYNVTASFSPTKSGTVKKPAPVGITFGYVVKDTEGGRPFSLENFTALFEGVAVNTNTFPKCSASAITQAQTDSGCPSGSLVATGYARNLAGDRNNRKDVSVKCYLTLRLHNSGNNKMALFVKGDPQLAGAKNCPISLSTAIPVSIVRQSRGAALRLVIPESLKHPLATLTNAVVEVNLKVKKLTKKAHGRSTGLFETVGRCTRGKRAVTVSFNNEGGDTGLQSTRARCS
jgi:hypothetical protein